MIDFFSYEKHYVHISRDKFTAPPRDDNVPAHWQDLPSDGCSCKSCLSRSYRDEISIPVRDYCYSVGIKTDKLKQDHFYFLCDYELRGYALNERRWGKIPITISTV
jgi:hypothetical protein